MAKRQSGLVTRGAAKAMGCEKSGQQHWDLRPARRIICAERCSRWASASILEIEPHALGA